MFEAYYRIFLKKSILNFFNFLSHCIVDVIIASMNFVFMHVQFDMDKKGYWFGEYFPELMVKSVRKFFPDSNIIQCTNNETEKVSGVDRVFRFDGDTNYLATFRLDAFSALDLKVPAVYLDTDMIILKKFTIDDLLKGFDVILLERVFDCENKLNINLRDMNMLEYKGKTVYEVWPYIGCFQICRTSDFWKKCSENLKTLDIKYQKWMGEQEASRNVIANSIFKHSTVKESEYACVPKYLHLNNSIPKILHFKGMKKELMLYTDFLLNRKEEFMDYIESNPHFEGKTKELMEYTNILLNKYE